MNINKNYKEFTYSSCSIINISININENNSCPRGEIGRHKGLKILATYELISKSYSILNSYEKYKNCY